VYSAEEVLVTKVCFNLGSVTINLNSSRLISFLSDRQERDFDPLGKGDQGNQ